MYIHVYIHTYIYIIHLCIHIIYHIYIYVNIFTGDYCITSRSFPISKICYSIETGVVQFTDQKQKKQQKTAEKMIKN